MIAEVRHVSFEALSPVVVETAVELGVTREARVCQARTADTALQAALMVRHIHYPHDVAVTDRPAAHTTQYHRHFTTHTIFGHVHGLSESKNRLLHTVCHIIPYIPPTRTDLALSRKELQLVRFCQKRFTSHSS